MWDFGNRGSVVLISVTCGCVLVYNAWGAILALALTLLLVVYACYSLLKNDSLVSPHAYHVLDYLEQAVRDLGTTFHTAYDHGTGQIRKFWHITSRCYRERFLFRMDKRRMNNYQLSSDSYATATVKRRDSSSLSPSSLSASRFSIDQLSPISRTPNYRSRADIITAGGRFYHTGDHDSLPHQLAFGKHTSTPVLMPGDKEENARNGDVGLVLESRKLPSKKITMYAQNHTLSRGENITQFTPEGSPWGTSISPKIRPRPGGVKTVQTIAGPLLASTRYNIDPKVYTDVSSPGLTTRLTKYATEAKNKLIYQSQYGTGQFPKVNFHANPVPLLNVKSTKKRMPVTVRVAPPDLVKYSPPERQKVLSNICHMENKSPTSVVQVLREISLKRHASTEDVSFDAAKKQKTESFFNERETILEENKQKRSRDDSSKSEEDISSQSKSVRSAKRTKTRSCYDILNSLSSSINVATGVKRKAVDFSRSGTPDFEKHFKSLESVQSSDSFSPPQSRNLDTSHSKLKFKEIYLRNPEVVIPKIAEECPPVKGIFKSSSAQNIVRESTTNLNKVATVIDKTVKSAIQINSTESIIPTKPIKLIDKLFMRAEPERNERLKELVEEQGNIKAKFTTDNVEEIKREDLRNMRKTNMKARLQSMFDAISGKAENKINPDVVIQAEDVNAITSPIICPISCATLNSSTTTTNVNTTPLSTAAIAPSGFFSSKSPKKIDIKPAFSLPNVISPVQSNIPVMSTVTKEIKEANSIPKTVETIDQTKVVSTAPIIASTESLQKTISSSTSSAVSTLTFGIPITKTTTVTSSSSLPSFSINTSSNSTFTLPAVTTSILSTSNFLTVDKAPLNSTFAPINPSTTSGLKDVANNIVTTSATISSSTTTSTQANFMFGFGSDKLSSPLATSTQTSALSLPSQTAKTTLLPINTTAATSVAGFISAVNNTTSSSVVTTTSVTAVVSSFSFENKTTASEPSKSSNFVFSQSGNNIQSGTNVFGSSSSTETISLPQVTTKSFNFMSNTSMSTTASSSFTTNTTTVATSIFGLSSAPMFSLGMTTASSTPSSSSTNKPLFAFGASNTLSTTSTATTASNTSSFSTMSNNAVSTFGGTTIPQFGTSTTTVPQFSATTTSIFATTSNTTSNTTSTTNIFGTTNNSQPLFGTVSATSGTTGIFNTPKTTASSIFAATTNVVFSTNNTASSSLFSNATPLTTPTTTSSSFVSPSIFGQIKPLTSFGTGATGSMFGSKTTPLFDSTTQTTTSSTFGITGNVSTSTITPGFNTTNNATPAFGSSSVGTTSNTQTTPAFGGTTGMFGSTDNNTSTVSIFGATNTAPAFGTSSTTSTFGTQNPTNLTFGSANTGTTFSDNKSPFGATPAITTGFGTSNSSIPAFGTVSNTNNASNNTNSMFVFGSNPRDGQQNTTFSFGSNFNAGSNNSTVVSSAPFQFGSTSSTPAPAGFNFTAPPANPTPYFGTSGGSSTIGASTFNPSTPGIFSIGSGSTAPRSRTIRTRKPR